MRDLAPSARRAVRPAEDAHPGRRELVILAVTVAAISRPVEGPATWLVAVLLAGSLAAGTRSILARHARGTGDEPGAHRADPDPVPLEALLVPAVTALAIVGCLRLVPVGVGLIPALFVAAVIVDRSIGNELDLAAARYSPSEGGRARALAEALVVAFLAFLGVAAIVPGGLPEPGGGPAVPLSEPDLLLLAGADALVAGLLGYRSAALRLVPGRSAAWSAVTYASVVAIAAAALRATEVPRLIGPAVLALVFFLWDAYHGADAVRRRDPRWRLQAALLAGIGLVVIVWNLGLR